VDDVDVLGSESLNGSGEFGVFKEATGGGYFEKVVAKFFGPSVNVFLLSGFRFLFRSRFGFDFFFFRGRKEARLVVRFRLALASPLAWSRWCQTSKRRQ